jgi:hypothetical protein
MCSFWRETSSGPEFSLAGLSAWPICFLSPPVPAALAQHHQRAAGFATPGIVPKAGIDLQLQKAFAMDAMDPLASTLLAKNLFSGGTRLNHIFRGNFLGRLLRHICAPGRPAEWGKSSSHPAACLRSSPGLQFADARDINRNKRPVKACLDHLLLNNLT